MANCEQNITDLSLNLTVPADTDLVIFTTAAGVSTVRRWSTIKPAPQKKTSYVVADGTELEIPELNGVTAARLFDIQRGGIGCEEIVGLTPTNAQIQFVPSSGGDDAKIVVSSDNPLTIGEWIKVIWI